MKTTSERLTLGDYDILIENEHLARYRFAQSMVAGKLVADLACGTGYGSKMLADAGARTVHGMDISEDAVNLCRECNDNPNVTYSAANAQDLTAISDNEFDVVVSFETIEHLPDVEAYLDEIARILRPGGTYLVSTPDRRIVSTMYFFQRHPANPYHIREFTGPELIGLLSTRFEIKACHGQAFLPWWLVFWPVQFCIKSFCRILGTAKARVFKDNLYSNGGNVEVMPKESVSRIPKYWVISCASTRKHS
jgi:2-polyprenyl-3-methyl-5-hydroxy-6-metoxy-1,4-benzoquinol methylase